MNRSNYKVAVESKKQAKQFKQALLAVGEKIYKHFWDDGLGIEDQNELIFDGEDWLCINSARVREQITFKELLTLLVNEDEQDAVKPILLSGRVAIQVNNEREFKLLMEHFHDKKWLTDREFNYLELHSTPEYWTYKKNPYRPYKRLLEEEGYSFIPFSDFAAELGIKVPGFFRKSNDGVDMFVGDEFYVPQKTAIGGGWGKAYKMKAYDTWPKGGFYFKSEQAAEKWIAEQNKPKELECKLFGNKTAYIRQGCIDIDNGEIMFTIYPSDLEDMLHIYKQSYK